MKNVYMGPDCVGEAATEKCPKCGSRNLEATYAETCIGVSRIDPDTGEWMYDQHMELESMEFCGPIRCLDCGHEWI